MEEEDDDLYGTGPDTSAPAPANGGTADDMEEGEEDEDDDEDDESVGNTVQTMQYLI